MEEQVARLVDQAWQEYQKTPKTHRFSEFGLLSSNTHENTVLGLHLPSPLLARHHSK